MGKAKTIEEHTAESRAALDEWNQANADCAKLVERIKYANGPRLERLCGRHAAACERRRVASLRLDGAHRRWLRAVEARLAPGRGFRGGVAAATRKQREV